MANQALIMLTGSTGFIGSSITNRLLHSDYTLVPLARSVVGLNLAGAISIGNIDADTNYNHVIHDVDVVIHVAARAHILNDTAADTATEFRRVNTDGTLNLAVQAAEAGVKRFIFISSIGVNGINSNEPFTERSPVAPHDPYSRSKYEAEVGLKHIAAATNMEVVIIRPPLVYGGSSPGNFGSLIRLVSRPVPLPFGLVNNQRSMVYLGNLVDFIIQCIEHPNAANQTFLISDGQDLSLSNLIRSIRKAMTKPAWLLPVPVSLFKLVGKLTGKTAMVDRLVGDLQVDSSKAQRLLEWKPPYTVEEGIKATVVDFNNRKY